MRILHTSDWHLGKRLYKLDRAPEHKLFLDELISIILNEKINVLLICGDIFDSPTPPHSSLQMFYDFLHEISTKTDVDTYIIGGNHDSGLLLEAPARLLAPHRIRVWGKLSENPKDHWIKIKKNEDEFDLCAIPFFRSYELLHTGIEDALMALDQYLNKEKSIPQLLMLHHLAGMYEASGSEQVISLSGVDSIPTERLKSFDYVAMGHIHKPQRIGEMIYYSGSPLAMRFSETKPKSVNIIELHQNKMEVKIHPLKVYRQLITIRATDQNWKESIEKLEIHSILDAVVEVQLQMTSPQSGLVDEIKENLLEKNLELLSFLPEYNRDMIERPRQH